MNFHYDRGLKLTDIDLAIDFRRRQPRGFISHAHADHIAPHEMAYCTPATARLYRHRRGESRQVTAMPFGQPFEWSDHRLTSLPAGHILGSAMLLAESSAGSLLYTGDFKLGESATARRAEFRQADILVMETTFGKPRYRLPPRDEIIGQLVETVQNILTAGMTPVIHAYVLGKAQEVTRLLTSHGFRVMQHPLIHRVSWLYRELGCELGDFECYDPDAQGEYVVITPPQSQKAAALPRLRRPQRIALTGWAIDGNARYRLGVEHALPLSDHADYDELFEAIELTSPKVVYCTHGPASFVDDLRKKGINAHELSAGIRGSQLR